MPTNLHSTMFLLIHAEKNIVDGTVDNTFTFHNVSINTNIFAVLADEEANLHSTMFLLIRI